MNAKFESEYSSIEFKDKLNDLIEFQREDNLSSHLKNIFSNRMDSISGKIDSNDFVIWRHSYIWSDMFYSVINGRIIYNGNSCSIELKSKLNMFGMGLVIIFSVFLGYAILTGIVIQNDNSFRFIIWRLLVALILFMIMQTVPIIAYLDSKRRTIKILTEKLRLTKNVC